jgi:hypothetical protein
MPLKTRTPGTELAEPSSRPLSTRAVLLTARVEALRANNNDKMQHRPKIFIITFFLYASAAVSNPVVTHLKCGGMIVKPETIMAMSFLWTVIQKQ